mgnify:FL=1|jgi:hypothetical protein
MARKRSSKINIENYVNGSPITPGVTYKLGDADTHTAWLLASSSPCLFKLSATAPTDELWSNITPEQFIINGSVAGQVIEIASPNGKYFVVPTNAQDKNASVESAHATIALHPLGFDYNQEYQALPLDGDGPVSEGFYKISNLESGKLYSINVHPDLGGLMETKPNPEFSYALFSVGADNNPKAFLAGGKTTAQLVFVATETSAILSIGSTIEEADYFVSVRNFSLGSGEGAGFDPSLDQNITGAWNFTNTAGLVLGNEVPLVLGQGDDAVKIRGNGNGAAVIEGTNASHMDVAIPVKFQNPTTFDDGISFVATTGEKMKCILFGKESGPTRAILYEESNGYLSVTDPNSINDRSMAIDGAGNLWFNKQENHYGMTLFYADVRLAGFTNVTGTFTFSKTPNANAGINIPLTVGAPTDTAAVNRFYALGLAGETNILTTNAFLNTATITKTGTSTVTQTVPYHLARITVPQDTHSTIQAKFEVSKPQWNYSSFSGFSFIWRATGAAKLTFGIGRGAKTVRSDLSIDSYSIIPANDLAYNHGEILDITFDNVRDTQRNGYTVRVREIYALDSTAGWQVKTTTSFIPATNNEPIPWTIAKVIYQQNASANIFQYDNLGTLWLMLTGGQANNLYKIATCRGVSTFETGVGISSWVTDVVNNSTGNISVFAGNGEYTYYQPGGTNPVFYGLEAMAVNAIESEEATDFEDINIPL